MTKLSESTKAWAQGLLKANKILAAREAVEGPTYYTDLSLQSASHSRDDEQGHYIFDDGNYWVNWLRYPEHGWRFQTEKGKRNGVTVRINDIISDDGTVIRGDTTYNGAHPNDIQYDYLKRKFEGEPQINLNYLNYSK